ncbi:MAG: rhomboid family intramembrane serine protease [Verrucomicrobiota bacterium]|nr:rhomboid family intramembrane serine protease [Verrucomicrobiota bacterium]
MELNHLFLFTAVATAFIVFVRSFPLRDNRVRWTSLAVLIISGVAWLTIRPWAGWVAIVAWCALLLVPALILRRQTRVPYLQSRRFNITPVVTILIIANAIVFLCEVFAGGSTNPGVLHRFGELDTDFVIYGHQYWRMATALFLHYGFLHVAVNLLALQVLGPPLERQIGSLAFAACYLIAGLGSSLGVVLAVRWHWLEPLQLVGASGCVMGVVGAWGGFLLRNRHQPMARQRLTSVAMMVAMQVVFDVTTPRVSMSAHLGGLLTGLLIALAIPRRLTRGT